MIEFIMFLGLILIWCSRYDYEQFENIKRYKSFEQNK